MTTLTYAGIGSRETPDTVLAQMTTLARLLASRYTLHSGGAIGADTAFARGAGDRRVIFRPQHATPAARRTVDHFHPAPHRLTPYVRDLHARNAMIVLGTNLASPVEFVICWTKGAALIGGTAQAMRIALHYHIPIINLASPGWQVALDNLIAE